MDIKRIRQLIKLMVDNDLSELDIESGQEKVTLKRGLNGVPIVANSPIHAVGPPTAGAPLSGEQVPEASEPTEELIEIKSPMVGTFYASPSPDSDPYVAVGTALDPETVVCIVEAMKVMNEIKADCTGTIAEVCVNSAQPVEFAQVLFRVRPS